MKDHQNLTVEEAVRSSNVGSAVLAKKIGEKNINHLLRKQN